MSYYILTTKCISAPIAETSSKKFIPLTSVLYSRFFTANMGVQSCGIPPLLDDENRGQHPPDVIPCCGSNRGYATGSPSAIACKKHKEEN